MTNITTSTLTPTITTRITRTTAKAPRIATTIINWSLGGGLDGKCSARGLVCQRWPGGDHVR